jgi:hypothetical protein
MCGKSVQYKSSSIVSPFVACSIASGNTLFGIFSI